MSIFDTLMTLPDHAVVAYYVIEQRGPITVDGIMQLTRKSRASIYRSLAVLRTAELVCDNGRYVLLPTQSMNDTPFTPKDEPATVRLPHFILSSPFGVTASTLESKFTQIAA